MSKNENGKPAVVVSVEQAQDYLKRHNFDEFDWMDIVNQIQNDPDISGSSSDYHNLAVELTREGCYLQGFMVVEKGLEKTPYNVDLLADAVFYGSSAGKYEKCEEYAKRLMNRPFALWNWRAFTFMIDYYMEKSDWLDDEQAISEAYATALDLAKKAQRFLRNEERGYLAEHNVHEALERWKIQFAEEAKDQDEKKKFEENAAMHRTYAVAALKKAIDNEEMVSIQCCLRYADLKFEERDYEAALEVCEKAFCYGEAQPSARLGYFHYIAALCHDCMINQERAFEDEQRITECYDMYRAAVRTLDANRTTYRDNIKLRIKNLETRSGIPYEGETDDDVNEELLKRIFMEKLGKG